MSFSDLRLTLMQRFVTEWNGETPVELAGVKFQAPTNDPYVRVSLREGDREAADVSAVVVRITGLLVVDLFGPADNGTAVLRELADLVTEQWDFVKLHSSGLRDIDCQAVVPVPVPDEPGWRRMQLQVPFTADYYRSELPGIVTDDDSGVLVA